MVRGGGRGKMKGVVTKVTGVPQNGNKGVRAGRRNNPTYPKRRVCGPPGPQRSNVPSDHCSTGTRNTVKSSHLSSKANIGEPGRPAPHAAGAVCARKNIRRRGQGPTGAP